MLVVAPLFSGFVRTSRCFYGGLVPEDLNHKPPGPEPGKKSN